MSATQSAALWQRKPTLAAMPGPRLRVRRLIVRVFRPRQVDRLPVLVDRQWGRRCRSESRRACKPSRLSSCNERADDSTDTE